MGYKNRIVLEGRKMFCDNCECDHTTFSERFDFLPSKARKTMRLTKHILDTAVGTSSLTAAKTLRNGTCEIGKSTICAMIEKTVEIDRESITHACIDDFAIRKGQTYGTCMTNALTGEVVDMIPSRDLHETAEWLSKFPNIKFIMSDGSYISTCFGDCVPGCCSGWRPISYSEESD